MTTFPEKLRLMADFYERHPDFPPMKLGLVYCAAREEFICIARECGYADKTFSDSYAYLEVELTGDCKIKFFTDRDQVCERRVIGKKLVPAQIYPEHEEDIIEWDCHPILKGGERR